MDTTVFSPAFLGYNNEEDGVSLKDMWTPPFGGSSPTGTANWKICTFEFVSLGEEM